MTSQRTILLEVGGGLILEREKLVENTCSQLPATNAAQNPQSSPWQTVSVIPICFSSSQCLHFVWLSGKLYVF